MWKRKRSFSSSPATEGSKSDNYKNQLFLEKLALTAEGLWTSDMEISLKCVEIEEEKLTKEFSEWRTRLKVKPEDHPKYAEEWTNFWKQRVLEVQKAGGDIEKYDYTPEWKKFWAQRVETLLGAEFEEKLDTIRAKHRMDLESVGKIRQRAKGQNQNVVPPHPHPPVSTPMPVLSQTTIRQFNGRDDDRSHEPSPDDRTSTWVAQMTNHNNSRNNSGQGSSRSGLDRIQSSSRKEVNRVPVPVKLSPVQVQVQDIARPPVNFTVIQILRRLDLQGDHLGVLADQVKHYFETAQQLEVLRKGNSRNLYREKEFLNVMLKCRMKFESLIISKLYPQDVVDTLADNIRNLNSFLELPECKDLLEGRPPEKRARNESLISPGLAPNSPSTSTSSPTSHQSESEQAQNDQNDEDEASQRQRQREIELNEAIQNCSGHLAMNQKVKLCELMATILTKEGRVEISDFELLELTRRCIEPLVQLVEILHPPEPVFSPAAESEQEEENDYEAAIAAEMWRRHELPSDSPLLSAPAPAPQPQTVQEEPRPISPEASPWSGYLGAGVKRTSGIAIPALPTFSARVATPPYQGETVVHSQTVSRELFGQNQNTNNGPTAL